MDDPGLMGDLDGPGQRHHQFGRLSSRLRIARQPFVEDAALEQLERDVRQAARLADVVDLDDVGMAQPRDRLGLDPEAEEMVGSRLAPPTDHLQGDQAVQPAVPRLVHDTHPALAQPLEDVVAADDRPLGRFLEPPMPARLHIDPVQRIGAAGVSLHRRAADRRLLRPLAPGRSRDEQGLGGSGIRARNPRPQQRAPPGLGRPSIVPPRRVRSRLAEFRGDRVLIPMAIGIHRLECRLRPFRRSAARQPASSRPRQPAQSAAWTNTRA